MMKKTIILIIMMTAMLSGCLDLFMDDPITQEAIDKKDPEICKQLDEKSEQERCFRRVAEETKNPDICGEYFRNNQEGMDDCLMHSAPEADNLDACKKITDSVKKARCYKDIGVNRNDENICAETKKIDEKSGSECYSQVAITKNNPELCKEITTEYLREQCFREIAVASNKPEVCDNLADPDKIAACKGQVTGNIKECEKIQDTNEREKCIVAAAPQSGSEEDCEKIKNQKLKEDCYQNVAAATGKESICDKLKDYKKDRCLSDVAKYNKNPGTCKKISDVYEQNICFENIALAENNKNVCKDIADPERRETCEERVDDKKDSNIIKDVSDGLSSLLGGDGGETTTTTIKTAEEAADGSSQGGVIDKPLEYGLDDLDDNGCTPVERAVKTGGGDTICQCIDGYSRVYVNDKPYCQFNKPEDTGMSQNDLSRVEYVIRNLHSYEGEVVTVTVEGKELKVGVIRKANGQLQYTLDGETYSSDLADTVNPGAISQVGDSIGGAFGVVGDGISSLFTGAEHRDKNPETDLRYNLGKETLEEYRPLNNKLTGLQRDHFAQAFVKYVDQRKSGRAWDQIYNDPQELFMGGPQGKGGGSELALSDREYFLLMEEAYQKYNLIKEL